MGRQAQLLHYRRVDRPDAVGARVDLETGKDFFGDRRAADQFPSREHQRLEPAFGEVGGRHQPIVTGPDDDGVVRDHRYQSFNTFKAASRPDVPEIPPPGCVPDPH